MLVLTKKAANVIGTLAEHSDNAGVRIGMVADGPRHLRIEPADSPSTGDQVIEQDQARVFVDADVTAMLDDQVLDAVVDDDGRVKFFFVGEHS
jgi:Fe-S cluster assembly iron-binding protein IscA